ncbi:SusD/RagB family nutrient-binding outer membrane lipoprotein [Pontibacter sp. SGAir0037]|uniref:SusD/RagB family nutrient-binding outer membrane lipoprotein n=1 Tax=Pontibacter sp. SGAir0037 TaxID=2571030 RepID=UPI0010CCD4CE|nr:SusD/RagB family nutrient-binding outer membrane lipoprotein [Pontibacter sp. SGAir0037]QCR22259.1 SusD/RagB family nutrient-binding outer membrane lipoprotein [Pontibacter sp. SGAir0037]
MKKIQYIILLVIASCISACSSFEEMQLDPNRTTQASPALLLTNIETKAFNEVQLSAGLASRYLVYTDGVSLNQYYGWQRSSYQSYDHLRQVVKLEQEAQRTNQPVYGALAKFFRSYFAIGLTQTFGDIPYTESLKGDEGMFTPAYDKQEDIYLSVLEELKEANQMLATTQESITGDVVYKGDLKKWQKLVNSFTLRVLINLSHKERNTKLGVKQRFQEIVNDPAKFPIFTSNADNASLTFYDLESNRYPYFNNNDMKTAYYMDETFVALLQNLQDPRLPKFADPAPKAANLPAENLAAYGGVKGSETLDVNKARVVAGEASKIASRYYSSPTNEPSIAIGYAEVQFILAEAAAKGWVNANAEEHYKKGIEASMLFYNIPTAAIAAYLNQPEVQLSAGNKLATILTQKYISFFMNSGWQPFYEQRRTGLPAFDVSGDGALNQKRIPKRWMYPESEFNLNRPHVEAAIARQYPDGDNINSIMWILKEE